MGEREREGERDTTRKVFPGSFPAGIITARKKEQMNDGVVLKWCFTDSTIRDKKRVREREREREDGFTGVAQRQSHFSQHTSTDSTQWAASRCFPVVIVLKL